MAEAATVGRRQRVIGFLLGAGILINYFDRVNISVAALQLVVGVVLLIGIFFFVVVLGKIEPIPEPDAVAAAPAPA